MGSDLTDRDAAPAAAEGADAIRKALVAARHALSRECGHVPHDQGEALELVKAAERALAARPAPAAAPREANRKMDVLALELHELAGALHAETERLRVLEHRAVKALSNAACLSLDRDRAAAREAARGEG